MSLYRILRSPEPAEGGSPGDDDLVTISRQELDDLRVRATAAENRETTARADSHAFDSEPSARTSHEDVEARLRAREASYAEELAAQERKAAEWERAYKAAFRDRELAAALAGKPLVAGAAAQLIKLWCDDFDVYEEGGRAQGRLPRRPEHRPGDRRATRQPRLRPLPPTIVARRNGPPGSEPALDRPADPVRPQNPGRSRRATLAGIRHAQRRPLVSNVRPERPALRDGMTDD